MKPDNDPPAASCKQLEQAVILKIFAGGGAVLTPAEAEQLAADLQRASAAARAYRPPVGKFNRSRKRAKV